MARDSGVTGADIASKRRSKPATGAIPEYLPASWKEKPFFVLTSQDDFGRRGDVYEYPLNENVGFVDLGRKARRFKIEGYLIGADQVALTREMRDAAESPLPGTLIHPMYGPQRVACVSLSASADYRKDKKRTKLAFDFIEAVTLGEQDRTAPKITPAAVWDIGTAAQRVAKSHGVWRPGTRERRAAQWVHRDLAKKIEPARDEKSWDAVDRLLRIPQWAAGTAPPPGRTPQWSDAAQIFDEIADPIDTGTGTVRRLWGEGDRTRRLPGAWTTDTDIAASALGGTALARLRLFNGTVVSVESESGASLSIESLIVTARLSLIRDFAVAAIYQRYDTKNAAFADLDFIMAVYDDEERAAAGHCWDDVVLAIRAARATAATAMLTANVSLPGVYASNVDGVWPSLLVAHKLYADSTRHVTVENYNTSMSPFFIGREAVAPGQ
jgi:hypothetical protein